MPPSLKEQRDGNNKEQRDGNNKKKRISLDQEWSVVEKFVTSALQEQQQEAANDDQKDNDHSTSANAIHQNHTEVMRAYSAMVNLETHPKVISYTRRPPTHGVRVRMIKLIERHRQAYPDESRVEFESKWKKASKILFIYHDRHYVKRRREESSAQPDRPMTMRSATDITEARGQTAPNEFFDNGTMSMFQLGLAAWDQA